MGSSALVKMPCPGGYKNCRRNLFLDKTQKFDAELLKFAKQ